MDSQILRVLRVVDPVAPGAEALETVWQVSCSETVLKAGEHCWLANVIETILEAVSLLGSGCPVCSLVPPTPRLTRRARVLKNVCMHVCI